MSHIRVMSCRSVRPVPAVEFEELAKVIAEVLTLAQQLADTLASWRDLAASKESE